MLLDPVQPRGLAFQLSRLAEHLAAIPPLHEDGMPEPPLRLARRALVRLEGLDARQLDSATLDSLRDDLGALSEAISKRFFLQDEQAPAKQTRLLA